MPTSQILRLSVQNMSCASCVGRVERALSVMPGLTDVQVNLATETVQALIDQPVRITETLETLNTAGYPARTQSVRLSVASMTCASCVGRVDKALLTVPGVLDVNVNLATETATVTYVEGLVDLATLLTAFEKAGYPATPTENVASGTHSARKEEEALQLARKTVLAASLALPE